MARLTTDEYEVEVKFDSAAAKAKHLLRHLYYLNDPTAKKQITSVHNQSEDLKDVFTLTRTFKDAKDKWEEYFHKGSHTNDDYKVTLLESTDTSDKFAVVVNYAGGTKDFDAVFNDTFHKKIVEYTAVRSSTKTKNLGVKHKRKSGDDILIIKTFVDEALAKTDLKKIGTVPKPEDRGCYKTTVRSPSSLFFNDDTHSIVCVHLSRVKVGIIPLKGDMSKIKIMVHYQNPNLSRGKLMPYLGIKDEKNFESLKIISDYERVKKIKEHDSKSEYWRMRKAIGRELYTNKHENLPSFLLSDPDFFDKLVAFFTEVDSRSFCATV